MVLFHARYYRTARPGSRKRLYRFVDVVTYVREQRVEIQADRRAAEKQYTSVFLA